MPTWMVVEDEPDLFNVVLAMYALLEVDGIAFSSGEETLYWIDDVDNGLTSAQLPEMALLDIRLPGQVSGPMIAERIRNSPVLGNIAIVMMTAYKLSPREEQIIRSQSGCDMLLYKPLPKPSEFKKMMNTLIAQKYANHG